MEKWMREVLEEGREASKWGDNMHQRAKRFELRTKVALAKAEYLRALGEVRQLGGRSRPRKTFKAQAGAGSRAVRRGAGSRRVAARRPG